MTNTEASDDKHRVEIHVESIESSTSSTLNLKPLILNLDFVLDDSMHLTL